VLVYALVTFLGALLLFQVQPLMGKLILPWYGGGPAVWTTCMLFFQVLLLAGYGYAHLVAMRLRPRAQAVAHVVLLVAAAAALPILPGSRWKPGSLADPTWHILVLLAASVGLPYLVLSTTAPLVQAWFSRTHPGPAGAAELPVHRRADSGRSPAGDGLVWGVRGLRVAHGLVRAANVAPA